MGLVYVIVNQVNDMIYVGQTACNRRKRWREHCFAARSRGRRTRFHRAMHKYGIENFRMEVIDFAESPEELDGKERAWIERLQSNNPEKGYNLTAGGDGAVELDAESRAKLGASVRRMWQDPNRKKHYQENIWTPERRAEMSRKMKERLASPEARKAISERIQVFRECPHCHETMNGRAWQKHRCPMAPPKEKKILTAEERKAKYGHRLGKKDSPEVVAKRTDALRKRFKEKPWSIPKPSAEGLKRIGEASRQRMNAPEMKAIWAQQRKEWWASHPEAREKVSKRVWSEESRAKARAAAMKRWHPEAKKGG